jgi:hypothetical protein
MSDLGVTDRINRERRRLSRPIDHDTARALQAECRTCAAEPGEEEDCETADRSPHASRLTSPAMPTHKPAPGIVPARKASQSSAPGDDVRRLVHNLAEALATTVTTLRELEKALTASDATGPAPVKSAKKVARPEVRKLAERRARQSGQAPASRLRSTGFAEAH